MKPLLTASTVLATGLILASLVSPAEARRRHGYRSYSHGHTRYVSRRERREIERREAREEAEAERREAALKAKSRLLPTRPIPAVQIATADDETSVQAFEAAMERVAMRNQIAASAPVDSCKTPSAATAALLAQINVPYVVYGEQSLTPRPWVSRVSLSDWRR